MLIKTSELSGPALDWAACIANGLKPEDIYISGRSLFRRNRDEDGELDGTYTTGPDLLFSRKWEAAGPIIDRHDIDILRDCADNKVELFAARTGGMVKHPTRDAMVWGFGRGPTKLIAAMRCFVASKLGDEVDVPEGLA